jgi:hypothetical protein
MRYAVAALGLASAIVQANRPDMARSATSGPYAIYWQGAGPAERTNPTEIGLLYTPELLATLVRESRGAVPARVRDASASRRRSSFSGPFRRSPGSRPSIDRSQPSLSSAVGTRRCRGRNLSG